MGRMSARMNESLVCLHLPNARCVLCPSPSLDKDEAFQAAKHAATLLCFHALCKARARGRGLSYRIHSHPGASHEMSDVTLG